VPDAAGSFEGSTVDAPMSMMMTKVMSMRAKELETGVWTRRAWKVLFSALRVRSGAAGWPAGT